MSRKFYRCMSQPDFREMKHINMRFILYHRPLKTPADTGGLPCHKIEEKNLDMPYKAADTVSVSGLHI
jgi:hypothetical protein